jgi:hypothetical protein
MTFPMNERDEKLCISAASTGSFTELDGKSRRRLFATEVGVYEEDDKGANRATKDFFQRYVMS